MQNNNMCTFTKKSFLNLYSAHKNMKPERIETFTPRLEHLIYENENKKA